MDQIIESEKFYDNLAFHDENKSPKLMSKTQNQVLAQVETAVKIIDVQLAYGKHRVLTGINMTVPAKQIYGLLGPSGCGKTSLLRCMVGIKKPDSGQISVNGKIPGQAGSDIPGPGVGYMPQEIALFNEFSIYETFQYFGQLYQINQSKVAERTDELIALLNLPQKHKFIKNLSGGQNRRVSLAVALIHSPPLVILDEPTVGVDPMLRQTIWNHLDMLCRDFGLTIIMTTQYIEEARSADVVSFMRNGKILLEGNPLDLLLSMNLPSLESVFLKLCRIEGKDNETDGELQSIIMNNNNHSLTAVPLTDKYVYLEDISEHNQHKCVTTDLDETPAVANQSRFESIRRIGALNWKNITGIRRNPSMLFIQFLIPALQCLMSITCLGPEPNGLSVAIYNPDSLPFMSELFLSHLNNRTFNLISFDSLDDALDTIRAGRAWAAITFPANYTISMQNIAYEGVMGGIPKIGLYLDTTNYVISTTIQKELYLTYNKTVSIMAELAGPNLSCSGMTNPISIDGIIYGVESPKMTEFMAPGIISFTVFMAAMALTSITLVLERKDGVFERTLVAGVKTFEFIVSQISTQVIVLAVQVLLSIIAMFCILDIQSKGSIVLVYFITLIQGMCGMALGLVVSAFSGNESQAVAMSMASLIPVAIISGIFWPVEAMPAFLKSISYYSPQTLALNSMRYVISRGWDIYNMNVIYGIIAPTVWFVLLVIISAAGFHNMSFR